MNATAMMCACGQPMTETNGAMVCAHCDSPCRRVKGTCVNCKRLAVKR